MADDQSQHLLIYEYVSDMAERRGPHRGPHLERIKSEREAGRIGLAGAFDPPTGAAIVFTGVDHRHVEEFVAADPYNQAGLISSWRVERWNLV